MSSFALAKSLRNLLTSASRSLTGRRLELDVLGDGPVAASALPLRWSRHQLPSVATGTPSLRAGLMLTDALRQAHRLHLEFLRVLPSRHHFLCHSVLHTVKKLSNFLLYVDSRQDHNVHHLAKRSDA